MAASYSLRDVLSILPGVRHAFAYGSAVLAQPGLYEPHDSTGRLVDFIMAVDETEEWHQQVYRTSL